MRVFSSLFACLSCFYPLVSQESFSPDSINQRQVPEVTVISKKDRLLSGVPGSATLIKSEDLSRISPLSGNEVFRQIPGAHIVDEEGAGLRANIGVRGLDPDRSANVLVLEDGIPVQLNPYGEPELYYTPAIDRMSAIEFVKGSGQIMFGPRTIGGVINYITADPPSGRETNVSLRGGSGGFWGLQLGHGASFGNAGLRINYLHKQADKLGVTGFKIDDLCAKFRLLLSDKSSLGLKVQVYNETSNATYIGLTQPMFDQGQYFPVMAPDDQLHVRRYSLASTHKYLISKQLKVVTSGYLYTTVRDWRRQAFSSIPLAPNQTGVVWGDISVPNGAVFMQNETLYRNRAFNVAGLESHLTWEYLLGKKRNQLDAGVRFLHETAVEQELLGSRSDAVSGQLVKDEKRPGTAWSGFVQNKFTFSERFAVTAGLRLEDYSFERGVYLFKSVSTYRDTAIEASSHVRALIPGLGLSYQLGKNATAFAGLHKGFAPPAIKNSLSTAGVVYPLDAQESWNYELGARVSSSKGIEGEVALFLLEFDKQVVPLSESSGNSGSGFANAGKTRHWGLEAAAKVDFGKLAGSKYAFYYQANATYARATYAADRFIGTEKVNIRGNFLPYAPKFTAVQSIGFATPKKFQVQFSGTYVSSQFSNELNSVEASADGRTGQIPAYFVTDAAVKWAVSKWKTVFSLNVKNLTDERYIASRRPQGIKVGIPRFLMAGVECTF